MRDEVACALGCEAQSTPCVHAGMRAMHIVLWRLGCCGKAGVALTIGRRSDVCI